MKKLFLLLLMVVCSSQARVRTDTATESVLVYSVNRNKIEYQRNGDQVRSIASITKLMTAMVTLDSDRDLDRKLMLSNRVHSSLPRQEYTRRQLLEALLINSDNAAAETLANDFPGGRSKFVTTMNWYAHNWDLHNTKFADPSGLSPFNVSTVKDVADLVHTASGYWLIRDISTKKHVSLETQHQKQIRKIKLNHTSGKILEFNDVIVSKTGLTSAAGWCVGLMVATASDEYVIVILGSRTKDSRLHTVKNLMYNHVIDN